MKKIKIIFYYSNRGYETEKIIPGDVDLLKIPCGGDIKTRFRYFRQLISHLKNNNYDAIMLDSTWVQLWLSVMLKIRFRITIILRLRGDPFEGYKQSKMLISYLLLKLFIKRVDFFITVSQFLKDEMTKYGIDDDKVFVVNTPILNMIPSYPDKNDKGILLFITNFHFMKKVTMIPEAVNKIASIVCDKNWNYKICLAGKGKYRKYVMESIEDKWKEMVVFYGYSDDIYKVLEKSRIFFHFSLYDAYPTVVLEALSCGVPVIAYNYGSSKELINDGNNGFIINDLGELEEKMIALIENEARYNKISRNAFESSKKNYPDIISIEMKNIINKMF